MEVGTEISQKIRSAIKAKLLELGSYVDDELPDYIMVMVANKKSRAQMNGDLGLFLATNTEAFTEWLHGLLEKLQTITIDSDKLSSKQGKIDKSRSSKEKKKEKSQKDSSSRKKHVHHHDDDSAAVDVVVGTGNTNNNSSGSSNREKNKSSDNVNDTITDCNNASDYNKIESLEDTRLVNSNSTAEENSLDTSLHLDERTENNNKPADSLGSGGVKSQAIERDKHIVEDYEDVRQMLVTEAAEDELAVELEESTEVEVVNSTRTLKDAVAKPDLVSSSGSIINAVIASHSSSINQASSKRSHIPQSRSTQESVAPRKRKAPTSVVASIRQKVDDEEEYDPHNPAFGAVASVVKVTPRKSSVPPSLQANRSLLLKAMKEAERSVAAQKKVAVMKPLSRDNSPAEVYSPKRKRSDLSRDQESPPLYIPSRKDSVNRRGAGGSSSQHSEARVLTQNDARHMLNRELTSRSRREKVLRDVNIDRGSSHGKELSRSPERNRRQREGDTNNREVRSLKGDKDLKGDRNFQITCHVSSNSGLTAPHHVDSRKRQHSPLPGPNQSLQVTVSSASAKNVKNAVARLGKVVVERNGPQEDSREAISKRSSQPVSSTGQRDAREDIIAKVGKSKSEEMFNKPSSSRVVSSLGKEAVQKQCEAAVISVQTAEISSRAKRNTSPDSRVVECDAQSIEAEKFEEKNEKVTGKSKEVKSLSTDVLDVKDKSPADSTGDDDDLSKMIDEDLGPELLDDTNGNEFTLDFDIDEDLSNVVGISEDEITRTETQEHGKDENRSGTRFIVTLDGLNDRHFHTESTSGIFDQFKHPPVGPATAPTAVSSSEQLHQHQPLSFPMEARTATERLQQNQNLYLDFLGAQSGSISQVSLQQLQTSVATVPSKLTPPKIKTFSISLKDSDDEHDDKEGKPSATRQDYYQQTEGDAVEPKRAKLLERCKFWPACAAGASCEYHHPTAHCKTFPNCKFGDKCLFIHPNCRFDSKCARSDCPYTHTSRRPALSAATVITLPPSHFVFSSVPPKPKFVGYPSIQTVCHYFPNCHNMNCRFLHPKPCKFGILCKSPACPFYHPPMPGKDKLKWQSTARQLKIEAIPSSVKVEPAVEKLSPTLPSNPAAVSSTSQ